MARRVIIGKHPTLDKYGMWVSKPTFDAASVNGEELLVDTTKVNLQPIFSNAIVNPTLTKNSTKTFEQPTYAVVLAGTGIANGQICYEYDILFGVDLGYIPVCFITYSSSDAAGPYPSVLVKSDRLTLQYWQVQEQTYLGDTFIYGFQYNQFGFVSAAAAYTLAVTIYYTVFRQAITDTYTTGTATNVPRVIVSPTKIKVSRDGFNVNTATPTQTALEVDLSAPASNQLKYSGIFLKGTARTDQGPWQTVTISQPQGSFLYTTGVYFMDRKYLTIPFGKTFSKPPQVLYSLRNLNNTAAGAYQRYSAIRAVTNGTTGTVVWVSASTTELTLRVEYNTYGTAIGSRDWEFSYVVFQA